MSMAAEWETRHVACRTSAISLFLGLISDLLESLDNTVIALEFDLFILLALFRVNTIKLSLVTEQVLGCFGVLNSRFRSEYLDRLLVLDLSG